MAKGKKTGGRTRGTPNKLTEAVQDTLRRLGCSPIEGLALISLRRVSCGTCIDEDGEPTGMTRYIMPEGKHAAKCKAPNGSPHLSDRCTCEGIGERTCLSCFGTLRERIGADLKFKADAELAQYVAPKRKAIEVTGEDGSAVQVEHRVIFIGNKAS